jgi:hypothetical protein
MLKIYIIGIVFLLGFLDETIAASIEETLFCETEASILAGAATSRDQGFPLETYILGQKQTRLQNASEEQILQMETLAKIAYYETWEIPAEVLRYSYFKQCMRKKP